MKEENAQKERFQDNPEVFCNADRCHFSFSFKEFCQINEAWKNALKMPWNGWTFG